MKNYMRALNRAFDKAFAHDSNEDNIDELLACMGEEMGCERISIFEENEEGTCDNTYEWCRPGIVREQVLLQHVAIERFDSWHDRLLHRETIVVRNQEDIKESDPDVYRMFCDQSIHSALVSLLAFHGKTFGFCILEDPNPEVMDDHEVIMPGIRYVLSSLIYSRNLVSRLRRIGYTDSLTGVGNRVSLQERIDLLDLDLPVSVIAVDVVGWDDAEGKLPQLEREQTLLRAGEILSDMFGDDEVFRVSTGEFVVVDSGSELASYEERIMSIRGLFREHNLLAAVAGAWHERLEVSFDALIHEVQKRAGDERRVLLQHRRETKHLHNAEAANVDSANIDLPRGDAFFRVADEFLAETFEDSVVALVVDINYFKLYNDIFGRKAGNVFLENIARIVKRAAKDFGGVCGYIGGDNFCLIVPVHTKSHADVMPQIQRFYASLEFPDGFAPAMGVYLSDDRREPMITLYDRALSALSEIKGDYIDHIRFYSAEMHRHQREDKILLMEVKNGLLKNEFIFYVQPQVHERTGKIIGGEALVRWLHEGKLIPPGRFIPVLEKTGYVFTVDVMVWEAVAAWQRDLLDRGIKPVPLSVNVSRVDFYFDDIADRFIKLIERYDLDPGLIGIEITESAFTDNIDTILDAVRRLHDAGFQILMDDFGSGSSSLSMLHTMNLDVLKTDVQFMSKDVRDNKAISIVESVISMAHMIGMSVVTEGVETEEQRENLIALGDNYAQGYYFYKPMPKEQFEQLICDRSNVTAGYHDKTPDTTSQLRFRDLIREGLVSETLLDNIIRASAVYREEDGEISLVQHNEPFAQLTGIPTSDDEAVVLANHLAEGEMERLRELLDVANAHPLGGSEGALRFKKADGSVADVNARIFMLYALDNHRLYLSTAG